MDAYCRLLASARYKEVLFTVSVFYTYLGEMQKLKCSQFHERNFKRGKVSDGTRT